MADVNGLKMINDSFGHAVGDELLQKASNVIKSGCRENDVIARLGGDEFAIILSRTDARTAALIIKRLEKLAAREKIQGLKLSVAFGSRTKTRKEERIFSRFLKMLRMTCIVISFTKVPVCVVK